MTDATINAEWLEQEARLKELIRQYGSLAVAYSGGVDSTYLADVAHEVLGTHAWMLVADTPSMPRSELDAAVALAKAREWRFALIATKEFEKEEFLDNAGRRCYTCKSELFGEMRAFANEHGIAVLAYGETADDVADMTRYGAVAAQEQQIAAPLLEIGMKKDAIRALSRRRGLPTWDKASFACLSSRIPTGTRLSVEILAQVERGEEILKRMGFRQYRVRHHGSLCRIEIEPGDFKKLLADAVRAEIVRELNAIGYRYVTLDLAGYRTGSTAG